MKITSVRRISQVFFVALFLWFCVVSSHGMEWWQLRGWPVNWFLQLDPLVALGTVLTTGALYRGLLWAAATIALTVLLGRFFCGWVCPFGAMHHFLGWIAKRGKPAGAQISVNRPDGWQSIKYYILLVLLSAAAAVAPVKAVHLSGASPQSFLIFILVLAVAAVAARKLFPDTRKAAGVLLAMLAFWIGASAFLSIEDVVAASLQTGLLDPIPLVYRSVNLVLLPLFDSSAHALNTGQRYYGAGWLTGMVFIAALALNFVRPRFYCRYVCPLGALYGLLSRFTLWRIGKKEHECSMCRLCDRHCEGACEPSGTIRPHECVLCMNCLHVCKDDLIGYSTGRSASGEILTPDVSRRGFLIASVSGIAAVPLLRIDGGLAGNWDPALVRPPGALSESDFLNRCIKCGQCARVCPTNVIHPCGVEAGFETLWTPTLNFRTGTSGCQLNCVACGQICPTAAIRPLSLDEKTGRGAFSAVGPVRMGTAFVDRNRCLPWAMDRPCIVCQENCPVSPKAIHLQEGFSTVRDGNLSVRAVGGTRIDLIAPLLPPDRYATGDYFVLFETAAGKERKRVIANTTDSVTVDAELPAGASALERNRVVLQVRLQYPHIDLERCTGCGVCEHECPVSGLRAVRVSAENESRSKKHSLLLKK